MDPIVTATFLIFTAYFVGSISSAIALCQLLDLPDPRTEGSQNPGATNVLRIAGKREALIVLLFDMLKGFVFVFLGSLLNLSYFQLALIGFSATMGHMYPIYYHFKGGKGVATALGFFFGLHFMLGVVCCAVWLLVIRIFKYSSAASMAMVLAAPFFAIIFTQNLFVFTPMVLITLAIIYKHKGNIGRLIDGTEPHTQFGNVSAFSGQSAATEVAKEEPPVKPKKTARKKTTSKKTTKKKTS